MVFIDASSTNIEPYAELNVEKPVLDVNEVTHFYGANTQGNILYYIFNFHDGTKPVTTNVPSVNHSFAFEGTYLVSLYAVGLGSMHYISTNEVIVRNNPPDAMIQMPSSAQEGEIVTLEAINIFDDPMDYDNLNYYWTLGDGRTLNQSKVNVTWDIAATYPVSLSVFDDQYAYDLVTSSITIENIPPTAHFTTDKEEFPDNSIQVLEDEIITFNASSSSDTLNDVTGLRFYWDFGDGSVSRGRVVEHGYSKSGTYDAALIVRDDDGEIDTFEKTITVMNQIPSVSILEDYICIYEGESYTFDALSEDTETDFQLLDYTWSFGETGWHTSNTWADDWAGSISVQVEDPEGATASDSAIVEVLNVPPTIQIDSAYIPVNLTLAIRGSTGQDVDLNFYEDGRLVWNISLKIEAAWSWQISDPLPINLDLMKNYQVEVKYSDDVTPSGNLYAKLIYTFQDQSSHSLYHTFNCYTRDPWITNPAEIYSLSPISFEGSVFDPGMDDISGIIQLKTSIQLEIDFFLAWLLDILGCFPFSYKFYICENTLVNVEGWITPNDIIHIAIEGTTNLTEIAYENDGEWPVTIPFTATSRIPNLDFLEIIDMVNIEIFGFTILDINVTQADSQIEAFVEDDDGGYGSTQIKLLKSEGQIKIQGLSPHIQLHEVSIGQEQIPISFNANVSYYDDKPVQLNWNFGDGSTSSELTPSHSFENEGYYIITLTASSGASSSTQGFAIEIENQHPQIDYIGGLSEPAEDKLINFDLLYHDSELDIDDLRFYWDFGDGTTAISDDVQHSYARSGEYILTVTATDNNGESASQSKSINVKDLPPVINQPHEPEAMEGDLNIIALAVEDSTVDEPTFTYEWYRPADGQYFLTRKYAETMDDGNYELQFTVTDAEGISSSLKFDASYLNYPTRVIVQSKVLYGPTEDIELTAYGFDSLSDIHNLQYTWYINGVTYEDPNHGQTSTFVWSCLETGYYQGQLSVWDGTSGYAIPFSVNVVFDRDGDGLTDEQESEVHPFSTDPENPDSDGDWLSDAYEWEVLQTDPMNPDSDNDQLYDGFNPTTQTGEALSGSDPRNPDTDDDGLLDGVEVLGWQIQVKYAGDTNPTPVDVHSSPLLKDTDGDGLTDEEEYSFWFDEGKAYNPLEVDTNKDGVSDYDDLHAGAFDSDDDGLSNLEEMTPYLIELDNGTSYFTTSDPDKADSDNDGLSDFEERNYGKDGYITNAMSNDTDTDWIYDNQELFSYSFNLPERHKIDPGWFFGIALGNYPAVFKFYANAPETESILNLTLRIGISVGEPEDNEQDRDPVELETQVSVGGELLFENTTSEPVSYFYNMTDVAGLDIDYTGTWELKVWASGPCLLEEFGIDIVTQLNPCHPDTDGDTIIDGYEINATLGPSWVTNPGLDDTDDDGLSDGYEIAMNWNPLSVDTDVDGFWDDDDIDPLQNLMIELTVEQAKVAGSYTKYPRISIVLGAAGTGYITAHEVCEEIEEERGNLIKFTVFTTHTYSDDYKYYFDVPDNEYSVDIYFELWRIGVLADYKFLDKMYTYELDTSITSERIWHGGSYVEFSVQTLGLSRHNTIVIYDPDDPTTFCDGHFTSLNKYNLIILNVKNPSPPTPFERGYNVIVIPHEFFINTALNSEIQLSYEDGDLNPEHPLPDCLDGADLGAVDRDEAESVSAHVDSVIMHTLFSNTYLLEILDLLLQDPDDNEVYTFTSSAADPTIIPETLGLPEDVLELIPLQFPYENGPTSNHRPSFWKIFIGIVNFFTNIGRLIWRGIVAIGQFFLNLFKILIEWGIKIIQGICNLIMKAVEAIFKAILLLMILIEFVMSLILFLALTWGLGALLLIASGGNGSIGFIFSEATINDVTFRFETNFNWIKDPWLGFKVPVAELVIKINGVTIAKFSGDFSAGEYPVDEVDTTLSSSSDISDPITETYSPITSYQTTAPEFIATDILSPVMHLQSNGDYPELSSRSIMGDNPEDNEELLRRSNNMVFQVTYTDDGPPGIIDVDGVLYDDVQVHIFDGSEYHSYFMTKDPNDDGSYANGAIYTLSKSADELNLFGGEYSHYFSARDSDGYSVELKDAGNDFSGPSINYAPFLSDIVLYPTVGLQNGIYTFRVTYEDYDDEAPSVVKLALYTEDPEDPILYQDMEFIQIEPDSPPEWDKITYGLTIDGGDENFFVGNYNYYVYVEDTNGNPKVEFNDPESPLKIEFDWVAYDFWFLATNIVCGMLPLILFSAARFLSGVIQLILVLAALIIPLVYMGKMRGTLSGLRGDLSNQGWDPSAMALGIGIGCILSAGVVLLAMIFKIGTPKEGMELFIIPFLSGILTLIGTYIIQTSSNEAIWQDIIGEIVRKIGTGLIFYSFAILALKLVFGKAFTGGSGRPTNFGKKGYVKIAIFAYSAILLAIGLFLFCFPSTSY